MKWQIHFLCYFHMFVQCVYTGVYTSGLM